MNSPVQERLDQKRYAIIVFGLIVFAAFWRIVLVDSQSISMDEYSDLKNARGTIRDILEVEDRFPPLYGILLSKWLTFASFDETGRMFSVICGVLAVLVVGEFAKSVGGKGAGLCATTLMAISPFAIWYALETRVYSLYLLLAAVGLWQFWLALQSNRRRNWAGFVLAATCGIYTHYYYGLLIVLALVAALGQLRQNRKMFRPMLISFVTLGVLCLPSILCLREDMDQSWGHAQDSSFSLPALGYTYFSLFSGYSLGPSLSDLHQLSTADAAQRLIIWSILLGIPVIYFLIRCASGTESAHHRLWRTYTLVFGIFPPLLVGLVSVQASFGYNVRHALWCFVPLLISVAVGAAASTRSWSHMIGVVLIVGAFCLAVVNRVCVERYRTEDARAVAQYLVRRDGPETLFVVSEYVDRPLKFYLPRNWRVFGAKDEQHLSRLVAENLDNGFWFAYTRAFHGDPDGKLLVQLQASTELQEVGESEAHFAGFRLFRAHAVGSTQNGN